MPHLPKSKTTKGQTAEAVDPAAFCSAGSIARMMSEVSIIERLARAEGNKPVERDAAAAIGALNQLSWMMEQRPIP